MSENQQIDVLKEQISFLEARIYRYEELKNGSVFSRMLFGGGRRARVSLIEWVIAWIVILYTFFQVSIGPVFFILLVLSLLVLFFSVVQLNLLRKRNGKEKYQKMVESLTAEKASMEKELTRITTTQNRSE